MKPKKKKPSTKPKTPKPEGRPTDYDPIYCKMLIDHRDAGFSFKSFAKLTNPRVCVKTLYNWAHQYPEFLHAMEVGYAGALYFYESELVNGLHNETIREGESVTTRSLNAQVAKLQVMNLFPEEYRERKEISKEPRQHEDEMAAIKSLSEDLKRLKDFR